MVEWAGDCVTFDKWRATPYLPSWNYSGARPTSDTKLCLPRVREQARECQAGTQQFPVPLAAASGGRNSTIAGGLKQRFLSHGSAGWRSEIKVLARLVSPEASLPGLEMALFSLCRPPVCVCILLSSGIISRV